MSRVIAVTNQKGGVGKTTTAAALITALHQRGRRVLGVDLDPQGNLGFSLGLDIENCPTVYEVFKGKLPVGQVISRTESGGDILPSNILLSAAELEFNRPGREFLLKNAIAELSGWYDYIVIDTPPALDTLTVNAYVAAEYLVIPMAPEVLSLVGVAQLRETVSTVQKCYNPNLKVLGILLNKFNQRLTLNREMLDLANQIADQLHTSVFETKIRGSVAVAQAPAYGESILTYAPASKPSQDFQTLLDELLERIHRLDPSSKEAHRNGVQ